MSINGLQQQYFANSLDGLTYLDVNGLAINGDDVNLDNLVPYTGAIKNVDVGSFAVKSTYTPVVPYDLTNKQYVDTSISAITTALVPYTGATTNVDLNSKTISSSTAPTTGNNLTNKTYVDTKVSKSGDTMTGTLTVPSIVATGLSTASPSFTLGIDGSNNIIKYANPAGVFTGSVSATKIPYASSTNILADSLLSQASGTVTNTGNETVNGVVSLSANSISTGQSTITWNTPYFTTSGAGNLLSYTYTSGQGFATSTAGATNLSLPSTGLLAGYNQSYRMTIIGFKTSASSTSVYFQILQGMPLGTSIIVYQSQTIASPTVATDYTFTFFTKTNGTDLVLRVYTYAGASSSALVYFNTITLVQTNVTLDATNVNGYLSVATDATFQRDSYTSRDSYTTGTATSNIANTGELVLKNITFGSSGIESELTNIINFGLNFRGSNVITTNLGGALRIDGRSGQPLFSWFYRPASGSDTTLATLTSAGALTAITHTSSGDTTVGKDFYIGANSSAWNITYTKGLYIRYSIGAGQDSAYIQSIDRSTTTAYPMEFYASKYNFANGNVGIGNTSPSYKLDVNGNAYIATNLNAGNNIVAGDIIQSGANRADGSISLFANGGQQTQATYFYVGGANSTTFYPCFIDTGSAWDNKNTAIFEIGRSDVHVDGTWTGAFQFKMESHSNNWGNGSDYVTYAYTSSSGGAYRQFIANVVQDGTSRYVVVWLRGNLSYWFSSRNGCALIFYPKATTPYPVYTGVGANASYTYTSTITGVFTANTFAYDSRIGQTTMDGVNYFGTIQPSRIVDCYRKVIKENMVNWGGGMWIYNAFYRATTNSVVTISGSVAYYTNVPQNVTLGIGVQTASGSYFKQLHGGISPYMNLSYTYTFLPFTTQYDVSFSTEGQYGGWYHIYIYNAYGCLTDGNAWVNIDINVSPSVL